MQRRELTYWKFGVVLRRRRQARGLSLRKLADLSGHDLIFIGLVERGISNVSLALAEDLARALETSLGQMIVEAEKVRK